eukprot:COSAG02_NODE_3101_length_7374_cov_9.069828_7_plen_74_part_00
MCSAYPMCPQMPDWVPRSFVSSSKAHCSIDTQATLQIKTSRRVSVETCHWHPDSYRGQGRADTSCRGTLRDSQ